MDIKELQILAQKVEDGQQLTDEELAAVKEFTDPLLEALKPVIEAALDATRAIIGEAFTEVFKRVALWGTLSVLDCPNKRVAHLAFYGKTERIRVKNFRRALRLVEEAEP